MLTPDQELDGSSPRPWGTHQRTRQRRACLRFIPTPVGNAPPAGSPGSRPPVHPHARGERRHRRPSARGCGGSSPRPWGTRVQHQRRPPGQRFIPTPVGNALRLERGEEGQYGSSPRPWGTREGEGRSCRRPRFIPTPVGNAASARQAASSAAVHPHARGERGDQAVAVDAVVGSSPRPWGTPAPHVRPGDQLRFIPTPVGNAPTTASACCWTPVHPHARGERVLSSRTHWEEAGSSPRPWGTHPA